LTIARFNGLMIQRAGGASRRDGRHRTVNRQIVESSNS
jgi:hypothetical protein